MGPQAYGRLGPLVAGLAARQQARKMKEISGSPRSLSGHGCSVEIDRSVMPITEAAAGFGHAAPHQPGFPAKIKGSVP